MAIILQPADDLDAEPIPLEGERWRRWLGLTIILVNGAASTLVFTSVTPGLQRIAEHFSGGDSVLSAQTVVTMAPLGMVITGLFAGLIVRLVGVRRAIFFGLAMAVFAGTCQLWVNDLRVLFASRVLLGASLVFVEVGMSTILAVWYAGKTRSRLLGIRQAVSSVGTVATLGLSAYLVQHFGWRTPAWMFLLLVGSLVGAMIAFDRPVSQPETPAGDRALERFSALSLWPIYLLAIVTTAIHAMPSLQMQFLLKEDGITNAQLATLPAQISAGIGILSALTFGWLYPRLDRYTFVYASVFMGVGFIGAGLAPSYPFILGCMVIEGVGAGLTLPYFANRLLGRVNASNRAVALGWIGSATFMGHVLDPLIMKPFRDNFGIHHTFVIMGGYLLATAIALSVHAVLTRGKPTII
ncbi:MAG: Cyanate permease [Caulobacter sp.]|nr:Cyanate permease [Caulobacter sp.]